MTEPLPSTITLPSGTTLDFEAARECTAYARRLGLTDVYVAVATGGGPRERVVVRADGTPLYSHPSLEAVAVWLDLLAFARRAPA